MMYETQVSHYKDDLLEQITVSGEFTGRKALMTRFKGSKAWSVRGRYHDDDGAYTVIITKGMQKAKALYAAQSFVNFG